MHKLSDLLQDEIRLISSFNDLLANEADALRMGEVGKMETIVGQKIELVKQLNAAESLREQMTGVGSANRTGMEAWFAAHPAEKTARTLWQKVLELARQAKEHHELNGRLINLHLQRTSDALNILLQNPPSSGFYSSDGMSATYTGSRIVDSA